MIHTEDCTEVDKRPRDLGLNCASSFDDCEGQCYLPANERFSAGIGKQHPAGGEQLFHQYCSSVPSGVYPHIHGAYYTVGQGCFVFLDIDEHGLLQAVDTALEMFRKNDNGIPALDCADEKVNNKVVKIIENYTGAVNKKVWKIN